MQFNFISMLTQIAFYYSSFFLLRRKCSSLESCCLGQSTIDQRKKRWKDRCLVACRIIDVRSNVHLLQSMHKTISLAIFFLYFTILYLETLFISINRVSVFLFGFLCFVIWYRCFAIANAAILSKSECILNGRLWFFGQSDNGKIATNLPDRHHIRIDSIKKRQRHCNPYGGHS